MAIYFIRHTAPQIEKGICYGQSDIPLAATFDQEAVAIQRKIPGKIVLAYSSPLLRCRKLASILTGGQYVIDNRLLELNFGDWELMAWDQVPSQDLQAWMNDFVSQATPKGESYLNLYERTIDFWQSIEQLGKQENILVITHGGVIRAIQAYINSIPLEDSFSFKINYGHICKLSYGNNYWQHTDC